MRKMKKLFAFLLTMIMVMGMTTAAFAAETTPTYRITVPNQTGHTYKVYQIFTGDLSENVLSNVKWGSNGTGTPGETVSDDILSALEELVDSTDKEKLEEITKYVNLNSTAFTQLTAAPAGYYLIKDTADTTTAKDDFITTYIVKVVNDVTLNAKGEAPTVDKKIVEGEDKVVANAAGIGETVNYEIIGSLPSNLDDYYQYFYKFTDKLSVGLTLDKESFNVKIGDTDVTSYFYRGVVEDEDGTQIVVSIQDLLILDEKNIVEITPASKIVLTYSATVNEDAEIAGEGNPNDVKLDYSNNPNNSGKGETKPSTPPEYPEEPDEPENPEGPEYPDAPSPTHPAGETPVVTVKTFVTELTITKVDENGNILTGAGFALTGDTTKVNVTTTTTFTAVEEDDEEVGTYYKLKNGTYTTAEPIANEYIAKTAGDKAVEATSEAKIYVQNEDGSYSAVERVEAGNTYYVLKAGNTADYDSTTVMYKKTTEVTLMGEDETATTIRGMVAADGTITFSGLGDGSYTISEYETPAGYNTIADIDFTVTFNPTTEKFTSTAPITVETNNTLSAEIENQKGATLPETGGMGTTLFYVFGGILVAAAGVLLITKRRMAR